MELRHLRYFVAVAEALNFSHAARRLHVSQPPLSRQIKDLEAELRVPLFERAKNKIRLTQAGQVLYGEAKRLLEQTDQFLQRAQRLAQGHRQELHIGYIANVNGRLVIDSATRFRKAHPEVIVKVFDSSIAEQVSAIIAGRIDLGFVGFRDAPAQKGLRVERIGTTYAVMALARDHPRAGARAQPLSAFRTEPFATTSEQAFPGARQYVLKFCEEAGFEPRIIHEAQQPIDILNLVAMGECVALVPAQMRRIPHPGVVFCDLREPVLRADSYVAWKADNDSELLMELVRAAKATYAQVMRKSVAPS